MGVFFSFSVIILFGENQQIMPLPGFFFFYNKVPFFVHMYRTLDDATMLCLTIIIIFIIIIIGST